MTNVLQHFIAAFPGAKRAPGVDQYLESMPVDSNCGDVCVVAIDAAAAFANLIKGAHGEYVGERVDPIAAAVVELCLTYICG